MRILAFLLAFLPATALAQTNYAYRVATPAQITGFSGTASTVTAAVTTYVSRITCTAACHVFFLNAPGYGGTASATNSDYIPANTPTIYAVTPGMKVSVIQDATGGGKIVVQDLSR